MPQLENSLEIGDDSVPDTEDEEKSGASMARRAIDRAKAKLSSHIRFPEHQAVEETSERDMKSVEQRRTEQMEELKKKQKELKKKQEQMRSRLESQV